MIFMTKPKYWWIPSFFANLFPITFIYFFITPGVKNTMSRFVDSLLKSTNFSQNRIDVILWVFTVVYIVSGVGLLIYYHLQPFDYSIDKYAGQFLTHFIVQLLLVGFFLIFTLNANTLGFVIQKIVISIVIWKMMSLTAVYLTNTNIDNNILTGNLIKIIPIIISIFALINSYYH